MTNSGETEVAVEASGSGFWEGFKNSLKVMAGGLAGATIVGSAMAVDHLIFDADLAEAYHVDGPVARATVVGIGAVWGAGVVFRDHLRKENTVQ